MAIDEAGDFSVQSVGLCRALDLARWEAAPGASVHPATVSRGGQGPMQYARFAANRPANQQSAIGSMKTISPAPQKNSSKSPAPLLTLCGVIALMAGCASEPESHVVSAPPPPAPTVTNATVMTTSAPTTTQTTQTTPSGTVVTTQSQPVNTIVVTQAPPTLQTEVIMAQPSSSHAWVAGYWTWRSGQYQWMAGHWEVPPTTTSRWNLPRWETESGGYRFYEGYWN